MALSLRLGGHALVTERVGSPPILLLDDVFSELDPTRRGHLVRRIAGLPQAFVTTTALEDLDPELRAHATAWDVAATTDGATLTRLPDAAAAGAGRAPGAAAIVPDAPDAPVHARR